LREVKAGYRAACRWYGSYRVLSAALHA